jgi:hypothetical protein
MQSTFVAEAMNRFRQPLAGYSLAGYSLAGYSLAGYGPEAVPTGRWSRVTRSASGRRSTTNAW